MNISVDATQCINLMVEAETQALRIKELEHSVAELRGSVIYWENEHTKLEETNASLREKNKTLTSDLEGWVRENINLRRDIDTLKGQIKNLRKQAQGDSPRGWAYGDSK